MEGSAGAACRARALHDQLVAYVHALGSETGGRSGVWVEHSYARAGGGAGAGPRHDVRVLLAPAPAACAHDDLVDVCGGGGEPRANEPTVGEHVDDRESDSEEESEVSALSTPAPCARGARLSAAVSDVLRDLRLARLAVKPHRAARREQARLAARKLRRLLSCAWGGVGAWLPGLGPALPARERALLTEVLGELRTMVPPALGARLNVPEATPDPLEDCGAPLDSSAAGPVLAWVRVERGAGRVERRVSSLLYCAPLHARPAAPATPDQWATAAAAAARAALTDLIQHYRGRGVVLCGAGAGAALAATLAAGAAQLLGVVLVSPMLTTAEGAADTHAEITVPMLVVSGEGAEGAACRELCLSGAGAERRLVLVSGAGPGLRLPPRRRARLKLSQHALDAAIAEEIHRWSLETAEAVEEAASERDNTEVHVEEDEYAHLPPITPPPPAPAPDTPPTPPLAPLSATNRPEAVEGRVVSRVSGRTPLALLPPRRAPLPAPLAPADILQLPIVFADDHPHDDPAHDNGPLTLTSVVTSAGGSVAGSMAGRGAVSVAGRVAVNTSGRVAGRVVRSVAGNVAASVTGRVVRSVTGNVAASVAGRVVRSVASNVAGRERNVTVTSGVRGGGALKYTRVIVAKRAPAAPDTAPARPVLLRRVLPRGDRQ